MSAQGRRKRSLRQRPSDLKHEIDIIGASAARVSRRELTEFASRALDALHTLRVGPKRAGLSIALVDDATMTQLNRRYRSKKRTTDVLTFPADSAASDDASYLGDIVISIDQARRQAKAQKHSLATELRYLTLHGLIHSLGYDHETDDGEMSALEMKARTRLGLD